MPDARLKSVCKRCKKWYAYQQAKKEYRNGGKVVDVKCPLCNLTMESLPRKIDGKWGMNL
jgi:hypothetical protein